MKLSPFLSFYGSKWRAAPRYPAPKHETIIEPFAGAAGYSVRHFDRKVILHEVDPVVFGVWDYLIRTSSAEILRLPVGFKHILEVSGVPQEAKWLMGFWCNKGTTQPGLRPSAWMRQEGESVANQFWGYRIRERIARQVPFIRHWQVVKRSWTEAENMEATWFVDPPYDNAAGRRYKHHAIDYGALGDWCKGRAGQVIACEQAGASWLPFEPFGLCQATNRRGRSGYSAEVMWTSTNEKAPS